MPTLEDIRGIILQKSQPRERIEHKIKTGENDDCFDQRRDRIIVIGPKVDLKRMKKVWYQLELNNIREFIGFFDCRGDKCRYSRSKSITYWCIACHGDIQTGGYDGYFKEMSELDIWETTVDIKS